jgi:hypothetical protein
MAEERQPPSKAHALSRFAIVDPIYHAHEMVPDGGWLNI